MENKNVPAQDPPLRGELRARRPSDVHSGDLSGLDPEEARCNRHATYEEYPPQPPTHLLRASGNVGVEGEESLADTVPETENLLKRWPILVFLRDNRVVLHIQNGPKS